MWPQAREFLTNRWLLHTSAKEDAKVATLTLTLSRGERGHVCGNNGLRGGEPWLN